MQKKLIALAVAGLVSGGAFAQSNVSIYGIVDIGYVNASLGQTGTKSLIWSSPLSTSRIGFKGTESLGNGMKADFVIETGLTADAPGSGTVAPAAANPVTSLGDRLMTVGVSGNFGAVTAGRQYNPIFSIRAAGDVSIVTLGISDYGTNALTTRANNSVMYTSPNMSGFSGRVMMAAGETITPTAVQSSSTGNQVGLSLQYANGPLFVGVATNKTDDNNGLAAVGDTRENAFSASYDFGMAKVFFSNSSSKVDGAATNKNNQLSLAAPVGPGTLVASYYNHNRTTTADFKSNGYGLGYLYNLSKRTTVYGVVAKRNNNVASTIGFTGTPAVAAGFDPSAYGVGIRHTF